MRKLTRFSLDYRTVTLMGLLVIGYLGFDSFRRLPRRRMPNIPIPFAQIITYYPGASAKDTERLVTKRLEQRFTEINDVKNVFSTTKPGVSIIMVELEYGSPTKANWDKLRNKVEDERDELPNGIRGPFVNDEFADTNIMLLSLVGKPFSYRRLEDYAETVRDRLKRIPDVGKIEIAGTQQEVINLYAKEGLTSDNAPDLQSISQVLAGKNIVYPGAQLYPDDIKVKLDTTGRIERITDLQNLIVHQDRSSGAVVRVGDLFEVEKTTLRPQSLIRRKGEKALVVAVGMRPGANVTKVGEAIERALAELRGVLPPNLRIEKVTDMPTLVTESIQAFNLNLAEAVVIVLLVAMLFMGVRSALVMAIAIPASMLIAFLVMRLIGWDLQTISIAALIIALGMLVDNAIVITDNIHQKLQEGHTRKEAAYKGTVELIAPVLTSTLTTVAIFVPLAFMPGIAGDFVSSIPVVVSIVLLASFLVAVVVTPLMSFYLLKSPPVEMDTEPEEDDHAPADPKTALASPSGAFASVKKWTHRSGVLITDGYDRLLRASLERPWLPVTIAVLLFALAVFGVVKVGKQYFPKAERETFVIDVWLPDAASLEMTRTVVEQIETMLDNDPRVNEHTAFLGQGAPKYDLGINPEPRNSNYAHFVVTVKDPRNTSAVVKQLNRRFRRRIAGARATAKEFRNGPPVGDDIQIRLYGEKLTVLSDLATRVKTDLKAIRGTFDVSDNLGYRVPAVDVVVDDYRASLLGLNNIAVAAALRSYVDGYRAGTLWDADHEIPILLRAQRSFQESLFVYTNTSFPVKGRSGRNQGSLLELGRFRPVWKIAQIHRRNNERSVTVAAQVAGRLPAAVMAELEPKLAKLTLPAGYRMEIGGESEKRAEGFADLGNAMIVGIVAIIVLLVILFNSFRHTIVVLATLPLSLMGAVLGLFVTQSNFGFMAYLGLISLFGVVVNNALVLLDYVPAQLRRSLSYKKALQNAGLRRLRPILLTTLTTVGGLLPLYFFGGSLWKAMSAVLMFGLLVSTFLTLLVIPCMYALIVGDREQKKIEKALRTHATDGAVPTAPAPSPSPSLQSE
jgi:multidrug efflux pump subunit AcrB